MCTIHSLYTVMKIVSQIIFLYLTSSLLEHIIFCFPEFMVPQKAVNKSIINKIISIQWNLTGMN